jgi:hypothetical protein
MDTKSFPDKAGEFLQANSRHVLQRFLLEPVRGTWHPNGFAVFHFGDIAGLGRLRLHIWEKGKRVELKGQPSIHSHPWGVCSLVVGGCYQDTLYEARPSSVAGPNRLRGYRIRYGGVDEGDELRLGPEWYEVSVSAERTVQDGTLHYVPAGILHATRIPLNEFAATVLITSENVDLSKLLLLGDANFDGVRYVRPDVSADDLDQMRVHLERTNA